jgi:hypothetical protein
MGGIMDIKLQKKLFKKYPKLFIDYVKHNKVTTICWGIECGNGWYWLIDELCRKLQWDIDKNKYPQVKVVQVKEKFGMLRFYVVSGNSEQYAMISFAEGLSSSICENCGTTKDVKLVNTGWLYTRCNQCLLK